MSKKSKNDAEGGNNMLTGDCKKRFAYLCLMRPPAPGAIPREGLDFVDFKEGRSLSGHHYWGRAIYNRELTEDEIKHYDLEKATLVVLD